mmetsp:Transcript_1849/g.4101  ORF Transcript_1849/g.4101 Transcript_1849/m.4101 type:complete len:212 (-) Transcript_1849:987-1622(-)
MLIDLLVLGTNFRVSEINCRWKNVVSLSASSQLGTMKSTYPEDSWAALIIQRNKTFFTTIKSTDPKGSDVTFAAENLCNSWDILSLRNKETAGGSIRTAAIWIEFDTTFDGIPAVPYVPPLVVFGSSTKLISFSFPQKASFATASLTTSRIEPSSPNPSSMTTWSQSIPSLTNFSFNFFTGRVSQPRLFPPLVKPSFFGITFVWLVDASKF